MNENGEGINILLIRFKSIGDILFTLPAVHVVRENFPEARITFMVSGEHAGLLQGFPEIDTVLPVNRGGFRTANPARLLGMTFSLLHALRRARFSLVIDFQGYGETALLSWCTGAAERWGTVYRRGRGWAYTRKFKRSNQMHPADWDLCLLERCGLRVGTVRNEFSVPDESLREARAVFASCGLDERKPTLFVQPFTSSAGKNWPLENYLFVADRWRQEGRQVLFGGGIGDVAALERVRAADFPVLAGKPLLVAAGLIKISTVVLGGDTGLLHGAVAMGKRTVMIMHGSTPGSSHPFRHPEWTVTPGAGEHGVSGISPERVLNSCERAQAEVECGMFRHQSSHGAAAAPGNA